MKKKIAQIIVKFVQDKIQEDDDRYYTTWNGNTLYWTEKDWENEFTWDGATGSLTYHTKEIELDNYKFNIEPFICDGRICFDGPADLSIKLSRTWCTVDCVITPL